MAAWRCRSASGIAAPALCHLCRATEPLDRSGVEVRGPLVVGRARADERPDDRRLAVVERDQLRELILATDSQRLLL